MTFVKRNFKTQINDLKLQTSDQNTQKLLDEVLRRLREILDETLWEREENEEKVAKFTNKLHLNCSQNDQGYVRVNATPRTPRGSPMSEEKIKMEVDSAMKYLSGLLDDKMFLKGTAQPTDVDGELFSLLAIPLMNDFSWNPLYEGMSNYPNLYFFMADILRK